jgi:hypothetical protein
MRSDSALFRELAIWKINNVYDKNMVTAKCKQTIPDKFLSMEDWAETFKPFLLEELRHQVCSCFKTGNFVNTTFLLAIRNEEDNRQLIREIPCEISTDETMPTKKQHQVDDVCDSLVDDSASVKSPDLTFVDAVYEESSTKVRIGVFSTEKRDEKGLFPPKAKVYFAKLISKEIKTDRGVRTDQKVVVHQSFCEDYRSSSHAKNWTFVILPIAITPLERVEQSLARCKELQNDHPWAQTILNPSFETITIPDEIIPTVVKTGNNSQNLAANKVLMKTNAELHDLVPAIQLIQGPPGTGKSTTTTAILNELSQQGHRVLATASTNYALCDLAKKAIHKLVHQNRFPSYRLAISGNVDRLKLDNEIEDYHIETRVKKLKKAIGQCLQFFQKYSGNIHLPGVKSFLEFQENVKTIVRFCPTAMLEDDLRTQLSELSPHLKKMSIEDSVRTRSLIPDWFEPIRVFPWQYLYSSFDLPFLRVCEVIKDEIQILFCTVSTAAVAKVHGYPFILVDEATQVTEAATSALLHINLKCLVLIGDEKQLPSHVNSPFGKKAKFDRSLYDRLRQQNSPSTMLDIQYRMHPDIALWPSKKFYNDQLINGDNVKGSNYSKVWHDLLPPVRIHSVKGTEMINPNMITSFYNEKEAKVVFSLLEKLLRRLTAVGSNNEVSVGIISSYAAQLHHIQSSLPPVLKESPRLRIVCGSVDAFQGKEFDIVLFSTVRSGREVGFISDMRRFNVAITRAKYSLVIIGDRDTLDQNADLKHFISHVNSRLPPQEPRAVKTQPPPPVTGPLATLSAALQGKAWEKMNLTPEFKASFKDLIGIQKQVIEVIKKVAEGHWTKGNPKKIKKMNPAMEQIVFYHVVNGYALIWNIEVLVVDNHHFVNADDCRFFFRQILKFHRIVTLNALDEYLREKVFKPILGWKEEMLNFARQQFN